MNNNDKKKNQLGMPIGTASNRLRKMILFELVKKCGMDICYRCKGKIEAVDELSIEHKVPYLDSENPVELFFDVINNISFSHLRCNISDRRILNKIDSLDDHRLKHGTRGTYGRGCKCKDCREYRRKSDLKYRKIRYK